MSSEEKRRTTSVLRGGRHDRTTGDLPADLVKLALNGHVALPGLDVAPVELPGPTPLWFVTGKALDASVVP